MIFENIEKAFLAQLNNSRPVVADRMPSPGYQSVAPALRVKVNHREAYNASYYYRTLMKQQGLIIINKREGQTCQMILDDMKARFLGRVNADLSRNCGPNHMIRRFDGTYGLKLGHAGKLDSGATGVLIAGINKGCRALGNLINSDKVYDATIQLGSQNFADVSQEMVEAQKPYDHVTLEAIEKMCNEQFIGEIIQKPPIMSSVKVAGNTYHNLYMSNLIEEADIPGRPVTIYSLKVHGYTAPDIYLTVHCSKGFYVRSLARDLGLALGTLGSLKSISRTKQDIFTLDDAMNEEKFVNLDFLAKHIGYTTKLMNSHNPDVLSSMYAMPEARCTRNQMIRDELILTAKEENRQRSLRTRVSPFNKQNLDWK